MSRPCPFPPARYIFRAAAEAGITPTASSRSSVTLLLPYAAARWLLPISLLHSARERRGHPHSSTPSAVSAGTLGWVPGRRGLKAQRSPEVEGLSPQGPCFQTVLGDISFPTTEKLEGTEELPEAAHHHGKGKLTTPPFTPGRRNIKKGRKNSGPCDILTSEAGGT